MNSSVKELLMQSSNIAKWAREHPLKSHLVLPGALSLLLIAMYFSGNAYLQNIVAPSMDGLPMFIVREFGALELLQNFLLLFTVFYGIRCLLATTDIWVKLVVLFLVLISIFSFLEEIDYGSHLVEYFTGEYGSLEPDRWNRNWHNRIGPGGIQNVSYLKLAATIGMVFGFVLAPLFLSSLSNPTVRLLVPSRWMISTVFLVVLLSLLAHNLDDAGYSLINGTAGNLYKNISEFRELNLYYLILLYSATLHERIITRSMG